MLVFDKSGAIGATDFIFKSLIVGAASKLKVGLL